MAQGVGARHTIAGMEERWVAVSGGLLRYLVGGTGPPLVLVHGIAASSFSFRLNYTALAREFLLFAPDLINVGFSQRVPGVDGMGGSLRAYALRLHEFLHEVDVDKADILGCSHGGSAVLELAAIAPERLQRMVLVSPANPFANRYSAVLKFYRSSVGGIFSRLAPFMPGRVWDYGIGRMYADPRRMVSGTGIGYARPLRVRGAIPHILNSLTTFAEDIEALRPKLAEIASIPTLVIWGDCDPVVEIESGYKLQRALGAEMAVLPGVGHLPYEESPAEFNRILLEWLQKAFALRRQAGTENSRRGG